MRHYTQLTLTERHKIQAFLEMGYSKQEIAKRLNRHRSTIYKECARNQIGGKYQSNKAHKLALGRCQRQCLIERYPTLRRYISEKLKKCWSPEQIAGRLNRKKSKYCICHETIYRYIYKKNHKLHQYLPYKKRKRLKPHSRKVQCRYGDNRLISERPAHINSRIHLGHWEGDSIAFEGKAKDTITTLVERKTRVVLLIKNFSKKSEEVMYKIGEKLSSLAVGVCKTLTVDQGVEFANYHALEGTLACKIYYCHAHSPWEKGSNENMNGRLRRLLPKKTDITKLTQSNLDQIAAIYNSVPRKCLGYKTPAELFLRTFKNACRNSLKS